MARVDRRSNYGAFFAAITNQHPIGRAGSGQYGVASHNAKVTRRGRGLNRRVSRGRSISGLSLNIDKCGIDAKPVHPLLLHDSSRLHGLGRGSSGDFVAPVAIMVEDQSQADSLHPGRDVQRREAERPAAGQARKTADPRPFWIRDHQLASDDDWEFELEISRDRGASWSWHEESALFEESQDTVHAYWKRRKGGRGKACKGMWKIYTIFKERVIRPSASREQEMEYEVGWMGSIQRDWEPEAFVQVNAPLILEEWRAGREQRRGTNNGAC